MKKLFNYIAVPGLTTLMNRGADPAEGSDDLASACLGEVIRYSNTSNQMSLLLKRCTWEVPTIAMFWRNGHNEPLNSVIYILSKESREL
jgi:hypothetical protein